MAKKLTDTQIRQLKGGESRQEIPDGGCPGLYLQLQPSGKKSWAFRYRHGNLPRKLTLGPYPAIDLKAAHDLAFTARQAIAHGRDPGAEKKQVREATRENKPERDLVKNVAADFLKLYVHEKCRPRTAEEVERIFKLHVLPEWGDRTIHSIERRDVNDLLDGIKSRGKPIAANRTLASIRKFFNWSVDRSIIQASPCVRIEAPVKEIGRERVLSDSELRLIWRASEQIGWPFGQFVQILMLTGQRRDEVSGMVATEIDLSNTLWSLPRERSKNGRSHDIPLSDAAVTVLKSMPRVASDSGHVFTTTGDSPISGYSRAKTRLDSVIAQLVGSESKGVGKAQSIAPWRLHDLRRTVATWLAKNGQPIHVIEALLNHQSGQLSGVHGIYNRHRYLEEKRAAINAWANHLLDLFIRHDHVDLDLTA